MTTSPLPQTLSQQRIAEHGDHSLPIGTRLGEFEITHRIGEGGFSVVYLAWDYSLDRKIALKEYMPFSIAARGGQTRVNPRSEQHRETFDAGLRSFINEAKLLAQFDHPSLVKVHRFWEANGTAYMVMPFYQGSTVRDTVRLMPSAPDEAWIGALLRPLGEALRVIHGAFCYHRDIAPDNVILLAENGQPLLLDFGAARRVVTGMTQALTVILKPGFAPIEQYDEIPGMKQGPWTDVYALAALVHWLVTGKTPPAAVGRMLNDTYVPLTQAAAGRYSERFLAATDRALAVMPNARTQSVASYIFELGFDVASATPAAQLPLDVEATVFWPRAVARAGPTQAAELRAHTPAATAGPVPVPFKTATQAPTQLFVPPTAESASVPVPAAAASLRGASRRNLVGGSAVALLLAAAVWWLNLTLVPAPVSQVQSTPASGEAKAVVKVPAAVSEPVALPAASPSQPQDPIAPPAPDLPPPPAPSPVLVTAAPAPPPAIRPSAAVPPKPPPRVNTNEAECASLLQRLSLGELKSERDERLELVCRLNR